MCNGCRFVSVSLVTKLVSWRLCILRTWDDKCRVFFPSVIPPSLSLYERLGCCPSAWKFLPAENWQVTCNRRCPLSFSAIWFRTLRDHKECIYLASLQITYHCLVQTAGDFSSCFIQFPKKRVTWSVLNFFVMSDEASSQFPAFLPQSFILVWSITFLSTLHIEIVSGIL
jgi:hypothetical protein